MPFEFGEDTVNAGEVAMANCLVAKGDLPIEIMWTLNSQSVAFINGITLNNLKRSSQITIDSVHFEHAGEYTCRAKNSVGATVYSVTLHVNGIYTYLNISWYSRAIIGRVEVVSSNNDCIWADMVAVGLVI